VLRRRVGRGVGRAIGRSRQGLGTWWVRRRRRGPERHLLAAVRRLERRGARQGVVRNRIEGLEGYVERLRAAGVARISPEAVRTVERLLYAATPPADDALVRAARAFAGGSGSVTPEVGAHRG